MLDKILSVFGPLDLAAVAFFLLTWVGYSMITALPAIYDRSLAGAIQRQRNIWMRNMVRRDNRTLDQILLTSLSQGSAFFASTSAIAIGGLATLLGSGDKVQILLERMPYAARGSALLFEVKLLMVMIIFVFAFFKFAWAFRLTHYVSIMIGATPIILKPEEATPAFDAHADQTARLAGLSAEHSNVGIRSFYYAIAAATWFYHPLAFMAASTWVLIIMTRRDFFSRSRHCVDATSMFMLPVAAPPTVADAPAHAPPA